MTHSLNQIIFIFAITILFIFITKNVNAQTNYFSPNATATVETTDKDPSKIRFKTFLSLEATKARTSFETIDPETTLANIEHYAEMFLDENSHLTELTVQEFAASGLPDLRSPDSDGLLAYQSIERKGIKPQVGFGVSLFNQYFNADVFIKNGKYSTFSLAVEGQIGVSAALVYKMMDFQHNNDFIQTLISSPKIGIVGGYDGSYNPLISIYKDRSNKHVNAFIGLDFPIVDRFNVYFMVALDMTQREEDGGQNFTRLGTKMSF